MDAFFGQSVNILETSHAYQISAPTKFPHLPIFTIHTYIHFWDTLQQGFSDTMSRSGKWEVDVYRFISKHSSTSSDCCVLFGHDHLSNPARSMRHHTRRWCIQGAVVVAAVEAVVYVISTYFTSEPGQILSFIFVVVFFFLAENLEIFVGAIWRKMCHYQKNVSQHYYLLDTLVK